MAAIIIIIGLASSTQVGKSVNAQKNAPKALEISLQLPDKAKEARVSAGALYGESVAYFPPVKIFREGVFIGQGVLATPETVVTSGYLFTLNSQPAHYYYELASDDDPYRYPINRIKVADPKPWHKTSSLVFCNPRPRVITGACSRKRTVSGIFPAILFSTRDFCKSLASR